MTDKMAMGIDFGMGHDALQSLLVSQYDARGAHRGLFDRYNGEPALTESEFYHDAVGTMNRLLMKLELIPATIDNVSVHLNDHCKVNATRRVVPIQIRRIQTAAGNAITSLRNDIEKLEAGNTDISVDEAAYRVIRALWNDDIPYTCLGADIDYILGGLSFRDIVPQGDTGYQCGGNMAALLFTYIDIVIGHILAVNIDYDPLWTTCYEFGVMYRVCGVIPLRPGLFKHAHCDGESCPSLKPAVSEMQSYHSFHKLNRNHLSASSAPSCPGIGSLIGGTAPLSDVVGLYIRDFDYSPKEVGYVDSKAYSLYSIMSRILAEMAPGMAVYSATYDCVRSALELMYDAPDDESLDNPALLAIAAQGCWALGLNSNQNTKDCRAIINYWNPASTREWPSCLSWKQYDRECTMNLGFGCYLRTWARFIMEVHGVMESTGYDNQALDDYLCSFDGKTVSSVLNLYRDNDAALVKYKDYVTLPCVFFALASFPVLSMDVDKAKQEYRLTDIRPRPSDSHMGMDEFMELLKFYIVAITAAGDPSLFMRQYNVDYLGRALYSGMGRCRGHMYVDTVFDAISMSSGAILMSISRLLRFVDVFDAETINGLSGYPIEFRRETIKSMILA